MSSERKQQTFRYLFGTQLLADPLLIVRAEHGKHSAEHRQRFAAKTESAKRFQVPFHLFR